MYQKDRGKKKKQEQQIKKKNIEKEPKPNAEPIFEIINVTK